MNSSRVILFGCIVILLTTGGGCSQKAASVSSSAPDGSSRASNGSSGSSSESGSEKAPDADEIARLAKQREERRKILAKEEEQIVADLYKSRKKGDDSKALANFLAEDTLRVRSMAVSPDSRTVALGSNINNTGEKEQMSVRLIDVRTRKETKKLPCGAEEESGRQNQVDAVTFTADGKTVISVQREGLGSLGSRIIFWNCETGKEEASINTEQRVEHLALAPDGKTFATTADADRAEHALWDVATRKKVRVLYKENFYGRVIAFSPDGRMLAMAGHLLKGNEGEVHIWDLGAVKAPRIITASQRIDALAFSPDGSKLVVGASEKPTLEIWDPIRGALLKKLDNAPETSCLAYCPDGSIFIAAGLKSGSTVYDGESFERKRSFDKTGPALNARACFSEGGRMLFMIAGDSHASVWDTRHFKGEELP